MLQMNPATGLMEDDEEDQESPGGAVRQQELAAGGALPLMPPPPEPPPAPMPEPPPVEAAPPMEPPAPMTLPEPELAAPPPLPEPPADLQLPAPPVLADPTALPGAPEIPGREGDVPGPEDVEVDPRDSISDQQQTLTAQQVAEREQQGVENERAAATRAAAADAARVIREQALVERQRIIKEGEEAFAAAKANQGEEWARYRAMGEKDVWGDNATISKVLAGVAILLSGRRGAAAFVIGAVNGLEQKKNAQMALQEKAMERAGKDANEIQRATSTRLGEFTIQSAAGLDAVAARMDSELASQGVPAAQRATNKDILEIKAKALEMRRKAEIEAHKVAEQKIKDDLAKQKTESDIKLADARTRELDRRPVKGAKGAGGGGGAGTGGAAEKLAAAIEAGNVGPDGVRTPLSEAEKIRVATDLGIPVEAKAGRVSLKTVNERIAFDANQERQGKLGGTNKPLTDAERASTDFAGRMVNEEKLLQKIGPLSAKGMEILRQDVANEAMFEGKPGAKAAAIAAGLYKTVEQKLNDHDRRAFQAGRRWSAAKLRKESGAAISIPEYLTDAQQFFGVVGDKEADLADKLQARRQALIGIAAGARDPGSFLKQLDGDAAPGAPAAAKPIRTPSVAGSAPVPVEDLARVLPDKKPTTPAASVSASEKGQALQWARTHRGDPRSKEILDRLGP